MRAETGFRRCDGRRLVTGARGGRRAGDCERTLRVRRRAGCAAILAPRSTCIGIGSAVPHDFAAAAACEG
jgi:hypothetical protein